jgi:hypothetical protein
MSTCPIRPVRANLTRARQSDPFCMPALGADKTYAAGLRSRFVTLITNLDDRRGVAEHCPLKNLVTSELGVFIDKG